MTTPADELRAAAAKLRDSHRFDGIKVDSDSRETLELFRDLLAARDPLAAWLEALASVADAFIEQGLAHELDGACGDPLATARAINGTVAS